VFETTAANLGDGDTDEENDVHLRDLATGRTRLVSATPAGVKGDANSSSPTIDEAGNRVAFVSNATNLGVPGSLRKVFVRDIAANTLVLASRADGVNGQAASADVGDPFISPDGGFVIFQTGAHNLAGDADNGIAQVYRRDLARGRTDLASRRGGAAGGPAREKAYPSDISANGGCVTFATVDALVGPPGDLDEAYLRVFDADCGDPAATSAPPSGAGSGGGSTGTRARPSAEPRDTVAPRLTGAKLNRKRFRVARAATALTAAAGRGTNLSFRSTEAGVLSVSFERIVPGRRPRRAGALTRRIKAGPGRVALSGRLDRKRMKAGRYRLTLTARDRAGNRSRPVVLSFTVLGG
jgi:hypothetical protein